MPQFERSELRSTHLQSHATPGPWHAGAGLQHPKDRSATEASAAMMEVAFMWGPFPGVPSRCSSLAPGCRSGRPRKAPGHQAGSRQAPRLAGASVRATKVVPIPRKASAVPAGRGAKGRQLHRRAPLGGATGRSRTSARRLDGRSRGSGSGGVVVVPGGHADTARGSERGVGDSNVLYVNSAKPRRRVVLQRNRWER